MSIESQVEREQWEIQQAPAVARGPLVVRCHFCGQLAATSQLVETVDGQERYRGDCCSPAAPAQEVKWVRKSST